MPHDLLRMHSERTSESVLEDKMAPKNTPSLDPKLKAHTLNTHVKNNGVALTDTTFIITNKNTDDDSEKLPAQQKNACNKDTTRILSSP